jgi:hypothetical protein
MLLKTIDYNFVDKWTKVNEFEIPQVFNSDTIYKNQYLYITPVIADFKFSKKNTINVTYSIKILAPDNSVFYDKKNIKLPQPNEFQKMSLTSSTPTQVFSFNSNCQLGKYKLILTIIDIIGKSKTVIEESVTLSQLPEYHNIKKRNPDYLNWISYYYKAHEPQISVKYFVNLCKNKSINNELKQYDYFFTNILKYNNFITPQYIQAYKAENDTIKRKIVNLLFSSNLLNQNVLQQLDTTDQSYIQELTTKKKLVLPQHYKNEEQIDLLWLEFYATGNFKPILELTKLLNYVKYEDNLDKYSCIKTNQSAQYKLYKYLVNSLEKNCHNHTLVKTYFNWILNNNKLDNNQSNELRTILDHANN